MSRILIVDDESMNREVLREVLQARDFTVNEAASGAAALQSARREAPDVILLDIGMPQMDGFATLKELRSEPDLAGIPVVAVTAFAMDMERLKVEAAGFDAYVSKPVDFELLLKTIRHFLNGRG